MKHTFDFSKNKIKNTNSSLLQRVFITYKLKIVIMIYASKLFICLITLLCFVWLLFVKIFFG